MKTALPVSGLIDEWVRIPLTDGRSLSARLWRPANSARIPAILDIAPYRAFDIFRPVGEPLFSWWAAQGYAVLAIDTSGAGGSTGLLLDEYLPQEIDDAVAAVNWAAAQSWCDGGVGLSGLSWAAFTGLRAAGRAPQALKAMVLGGVSEDGWTTDVQNLGGATYAARVDWAGVMLMFNALPPDPKQFGVGWRDAWMERLKATGRPRRLRSPGRFRCCFIRDGPTNTPPLCCASRHRGRVPSAPSSARGSTQSRRQRLAAHRSASCRRRCGGGIGGSRAVTPGSWMIPNYASGWRSRTATALWSKVVGRACPGRWRPVKPCSFDLDPVRWP